MLMKRMCLASMGFTTQSGKLLKRKGDGISPNRASTTKKRGLPFYLQVSHYVIENKRINFDRFFASHYVSENK